MNQTTANENKFIMGSAMIKAGTSLLTLADLGAASGIKISETFEQIKIKFDNAPEKNVGIKNHKVVCEGQLFEIDLDNIAMLRGGIDTVTPEAASLVEDHDMVVASGDWEYSKFIELDKQNGDGTCPTINSVVGSVNTPLVLNTDYFVMQNGAGKWGIYIIDSETVSTENQSITINTDYTPAASRTFTTGGKRTVSARVVQFIHTNDDSETVTFTVYAAKTSEGLTIEFPADDADSLASVPFKMEGELDTSRGVGDQLFSIVDTRVY